MALLGSLIKAGTSVAKAVSNANKSSSSKSSSSSSSSSSKSSGGTTTYKTPSTKQEVSFQTGSQAQKDYINDRWGSKMVDTPSDYKLPDNVVWASGGNGNITYTNSQGQTQSFNSGSKEQSNFLNSGAYDDFSWSGLNKPASTAPNYDQMLQQALTQQQMQYQDQFAQQQQQLQKQLAEQQKKNEEEQKRLQAIIEDIKNKNNYQNSISTGSGNFFNGVGTGEHVYSPGASANTSGYTVNQSVRDETLNRYLNNILTGGF